jgi:c-di-AMP phosphodiesterase-like protein
MIKDTTLKILATCLLSMLIVSVVGVILGIVYNNWVFSIIALALNILCVISNRYIGRRLKRHD